METADLASIPLFAGLSASDLSRVAAAARPVRFAVGYGAVQEGEFAFDFYAIVRGEAEVRRAGERIATLGPGDFFGEIGVVGAEAHRRSRRRGASVVITAPTDAVAIAGTDFRRLADDIPALGTAVRSAAAERAEAR
jgi:CRP-like cAMP-binding protein